MFAEKQYCPKPNSYYYVIAKRNEKVLEGNPLFDENGAKVQIGTKSDGFNQQWSFVMQDDGKYLVLNRKTGKQLDVEARGMDNGAVVQLWETTKEGQLWELDLAEDGHYRIRSVHANKVLDIVGLSDCDGANIQIWENTEGDNQLWKLVEINNTDIAEPALEKKESPKKLKTKKPSTPKTRTKTSDTAGTVSSTRKRSTSKKEV